MTAGIPKMRRQIHVENLRQLMAEQHQPRFLNDELISVQDLASELGVSVRTLQRWNRRADTPERFKKNGRLRCYRKKDVEVWPPVIAKRREISKQRDGFDG